MAEAFPVANLFSEDYLETKEQKIINCANKIDDIFHYIRSSECLPLTFDTPLGTENFKRIGNMFEALSRKLSHMSVENYLFEVVTPGVPDFSSEIDRSKFWCQVCESKLEKIREYLWKPELNNNVPVLDALWLLLNKITHSLHKVCIRVGAYHSPS